MFDVVGLFILETSMNKNKNAEDVAGDLTADLAALREDVTRLAETLSKLVQRQTQAAGLGVSDAVGDARDKIASTAADAQSHVRAASGQIEASIERNPLIAVLIAFGRNVARHDEPVAWLIAHDPLVDRPCGLRC